MTTALICMIDHGKSSLLCLESKTFSLRIHFPFASQTHSLLWELFRSLFHTSITSPATLIACINPDTLTPVSFDQLWNGRCWHMNPLSRRFSPISMSTALELYDTFALSLTSCFHAHIQGCASGLELIIYVRSNQWRAFWIRNFVFHSLWMIAVSHSNEIKMTWHNLKLQQIVALGVRHHWGEPQLARIRKVYQSVLVVDSRKLQSLSTHIHPVKGSADDSSC